MSDLKELQKQLAAAERLILDLSGEVAAREAGGSPRLLRGAVLDRARTVYDSAADSYRVAVLNDRGDERISIHGPVSLVDYLGELRTDAAWEDAFPAQGERRETPRAQQPPAPAGGTTVPYMDASQPSDRSATFLTGGGAVRASLEDVIAGRVEIS